jgi:hypothetical protein
LSERAGKVRPAMKKAGPATVLLDMETYCFLLKKTLLKNPFYKTLPGYFLHLAGICQIRLEF